MPNSYIHPLSKSHISILGLAQYAYIHSCNRTLKTPVRAMRPNGPRQQRRLWPLQPSTRDCPLSSLRHFCFQAALRGLSLWRPI